MFNLLAIISKRNWQTNCIVNGHLISEPSISTKQTTDFKVAKFDLGVKEVKVSPVSSFEETMMGMSHQCYISKFVEIGPLFQENVFEVFYHIGEWQPSWSCEQHHVTEFLFRFT